MRTGHRLLYAIGVGILLEICIAGCVAANTSEDETVITKTDREVEVDTNKLSPQENPLIAAVVVETYNTLGVDSFQSETIFRNGTLIDSWKDCAADGHNFEGCKTLPAYVDRLSLKYSFLAERLDEYTLHEPSVAAITNGARVELNDFTFRDDLRFTMMFQCEIAPNTSSTEVLDLKIPILPDFAITTRFLKNCSSGFHPYVSVGIVKGGVASVLQRPYEQIRVPPNVLTTDFFIRLTQPAWSQIHERASVSSSDDGVHASIRGISNARTIVVGEDVLFSVLYDCVRNVRADVDVEIPIPPWQPVKIGMSKECGGRIARMLCIGTTKDSSDVVKDGVVMGDFNMSEGSVGMSEKEMFEVGAESHGLKLYIRNTNKEEEEEETMHVGRIHFTVRDKDIVSVTSGNHKGSDIGAMRSGTTVTEEVRFVCKNEGQTVVMMSIAILQYEVVDLRLRKICLEPKIYQAFGAQRWWTVNGLEDLAFIVFAALGIACCVRIQASKHRDSRASQRYERVATSPS